MIEVKNMPVGDLVPNPDNTRLHSDADVHLLAGVIEEYGWTTPILADHMIRAGHRRLEAAKLIYGRGGVIKTPGGETLPDGTVPVIDCTGWSEQQQRAYVIADNQLTIAGEWDLDKLQAEMSALIEANYSAFEFTGFDAKGFADLMATAKRESERDPDEEIAPSDNPVSIAGDLWQLGKHRIICGSSTDPETVGALLGDESPHLMVTDPPYGVKYDADWRNHTGDLGRSARATGKVMNDDRADWAEAWALFRGDVAYVWHAGNMAHVVAESLIREGLDIRAQIIWSKSNMVIGRGDYHPKHEPCWYAVRKGRKGHYRGGRKQTTVWEIDKPMRSETGHSTQKPVECMRRPIENNSLPGEAVYEPFSGSGTTIIAAQMTDRRCFAVELNPVYVDMAVRRWEAFTGEKAVHVPTGATFADTAAHRGIEIPGEAAHARPADQPA